MLHVGVSSITSQNKETHISQNKVPKQRNTHLAKQSLKTKKHTSQNMHLVFFFASQKLKFWYRFTHVDVSKLNKETHISKQRNTIFLHVSMSHPKTKNTSQN